MHISRSSFFAAAMAVLGMVELVMAVPVPCDDVRFLSPFKHLIKIIRCMELKLMLVFIQNTRDQVLNKQLDSSNCCPYGVCIQVGDANRNIEGGVMKR